MKKVWIDARPFNKELILSALEGGADGVIVDKDSFDKVKSLGKITVISESGDLKLNKDVYEIVINNKEDEKQAADLGKSATVIVDTTDWTIIPLENIIAQTDNVFAVVRNLNEIDTALGILEKGVEGIVLKDFNPIDISKTINNIKKNDLKISLNELTVTEINPLGMGDRVCVDTCTQMAMGQGMLLGNTSAGFFLIHSETEENPYVEPRPFRVNAGGIHAYILSPEGKTNYLSELKSGNNVLIVNSKGYSETGIVGRVKIEKRPMMYLEAESNGIKASIILQNAETIRLVKPDGKPISILSLKKGDKILGHTTTSGRHFGMAVEETIVER